VAYLGLDSGTGMSPLLFSSEAISVPCFKSVHVSRIPDLRVSTERGHSCPLPPISGVGKPPLRFQLRILRAGGVPDPCCLHSDKERSETELTCRQQERFLGLSFADSRSHPLSRDFVLRKGLMRPLHSASGISVNRPSDECNLGGAMTCFLDGMTHAKKQRGIIGLW
jgi:hypothetical protein